MEKKRTYATVGDFINDLFCKNYKLDDNTNYRIITTKDTSRTQEAKSPKNKRDFLLECLPDVWIDKNEYYETKNSSIHTALSNLSSSDTKDNSIASSILTRFLINPSETRDEIVEHVQRFMAEWNLFVNQDKFNDYIEVLAKYFINPALENESVPDSKGEDKENWRKNICNKVNKLLAEKKNYEIIAKFYLSIVVLDRIKKKGDVDKKLILNLIWFSPDEIAKTGKLKDMEYRSASIVYPYVKIFFDHKLYELSFALMPSINNLNSDIPKSVIVNLTAEHHLMGKGCDKNIKQAYRILKDYNDSKCSKIKNEIGKVSSSWQIKANEKKEIIDIAARASISEKLIDIENGIYGNIEIADKTENSREKKNSLQMKNIIDFLPDCHKTNGVKTFDFSNKAFNSDCRVINGNSKEALIFEASLDDEHLTVAFSNEKALGSAIKAAENKKKVDFLMFSDDEHKNLKDCLNLLSRLETIENVVAVSEYIDIYVKADYEYASMIVDSTLNMMNCCFRIHICDYNKLSAQRLLTDAPLFIPCLTENSKVNVVIFGTNERTLTLAKEMVAIAYTKNVPQVALLGENAALFEKKLVQQAPGIYKEAPTLSRIIPKFFDCDIESTDFIDLLTPDNFDSSVPEIRDVLREGTYFIVDFGSDDENIIFATKLRGWLLSCDYNFKRTPFIAVRCRDGCNANIARHLVVNNRKPGNRFYDNYNLYFYGTKESVFCSDYLDITKNKLRQFGLNIHFAYYGNDIDETVRLDAIDSYFRYSYNRDSSECAAMSLGYMLHCLGLIKKIEDIKFIDVTEDMANKYIDWIKKENNINRASAFEHARWAGFLLSRGWRSASYEQVASYSGQESGKDHKHLLCKLHPFLCNWGDFFDDSLDENVKIRILHEAITDLRLPVDTTRAIVCAVDKVLTKNPFEKIVLTQGR